MKAQISDTEALIGLKPIALRAYVEAQGWKLVATNSLARIYVSPTNENLICRLPTSHEADDYAQVVHNLLDALSKNEERDELALYRDLANASVDVIRVRAGEANDDGSVSILSGVQLVDGARDMLMSAAAATVEYRRSYHLLKMSFVEEYISKVRLGQTEQGSFVVSLLSPVSPAFSGFSQGSFWPDLEEEPQERLVVRVLRDALLSVKSAVNDSVASNLGEAFEATVGLGVSANFCESLANITRASGSSSISLTWALTRPAPPSRNIISFSSADAEILAEAAKYFRAREPRVNQSLMGYVTKTDRDEIDSDGVITLKTFIDGRPKSLRVDLEQGDYERAVDAHLKQVPVALTGELRPIGQRWKLVNARDLRVLADPDD